MNQQIYYQPQMASIAERVNKPVRIVQAIQMHNEEEFAFAVLSHLYNEVDRILVIEGAVANRPNATPDGHSTDRTVEIIQDFKANHDPDKKVIFISINRPWKNLEEMKQTFLDMSMPGDIILINDADEFYDPKDISRIRQFFDLQPHATELIVNFLHFYGDCYHVAKPGPEWSTAHQRIIKYVRGSKYISHPVLTDPAGHCTYFSPHYQYRRFVPKNPINVYHYGYARNNMDEIMKRKQEYYTKELMAHGAANKKFDQKIYDWFNKTEPVLEYDGFHPDVILQHSMFQFKRNDLNIVGNWKDDELYCKILDGKEIGNIPLCMNHQAQPYMSFYHNGIDI